MNKIDFLGESKVLASIDDNDEFVGFMGPEIHKAAIQCCRQQIERRPSDKSQESSVIEYYESSRALSSSETRVTAKRAPVSELPDTPLDESRKHEREWEVLKAKLKKAHVKIKTLERSVEQKTTENGDLTALCDELL